MTRAASTLRGRDPIAYFATPGGSTRVGAAYEMVSDCQSDIATWVDLLKKQGYRRLGLIGHSLGAVKAAFYACNASVDIDLLDLYFAPKACVGEVLASDAKYSSNYAGRFRSRPKNSIATRKARIASYDSLSSTYADLRSNISLTSMDKEDRHDYLSGWLVKSPFRAYGALVIKK